MNEEFAVLVTWIRKEDMELLKSAVVLNRSTSMGQNYMYWKEDNIAEIWYDIFDCDDEFEILAIEEIFDIRQGN